MVKRLVGFIETSTLIPWSTIGMATGWLIGLLVCLYTLQASTPTVIVQPPQYQMQAVYTITSSTLYILDTHTGTVYTLRGKELVQVSNIPENEEKNR